MNSLEVELDGGQPVCAGAAVETVEGGVVELGKALTARLRGLVGGVDALLDVVVAVEPVVVNDLVRHPAAVAAELELGAGIHEPGGDGEGAVGAFDRHRGDFLMGERSEVGIRNSEFGMPPTTRTGRAAGGFVVQPSRLHC